MPFEKEKTKFKESKHSIIIGFWLELKNTSTKN